MEKIYCKTCKKEMEMFGVSEDGLFKYCCRNEKCDNRTFEYINQKINYKKMGIPLIGRYWDF